MKEDHVKSYWEAQARTHGESHWASWGDHWMIDLEVSTVAKYLRGGARVLDIGCANGHATLRQASLHTFESITGVDFAPTMLAAARVAAEKAGAAGVRFLGGDVRALPFGDGAFDAAYTTRVLINLPTWAQQTQGLAECLRVVRPGGTLVLCEAFWEPLVLLNAMRHMVGLPPLVEHDFNRYLKKQALETWLRDRGLSFTVDEFSSIYYLGSRLVRELVTDASAYPGFSNPVNERFHALETEYSGGGMGIQQAYVITRPR